MESTTEDCAERSDVLSSFLMPHVLLDPPSADDSPEVRRVKLRRNRVWLRRWLPTYIGRWALIFLTSWTATAVAADWDHPLFLDWVLEFAMFASGGLALGFIGLLFLSSLTEK